MSKIINIIAELKQNSKYESDFKDLCEDYEKVLDKLRYKRLQILPFIKAKQEKKDFHLKIQADEIMLSRIKQLIYEKRREVLGEALLPKYFMTVASELL